MDAPSISSEPITASSASLSLGGSLTSFTLFRLLYLLRRGFGFLCLGPRLLFFFLFSIHRFFFFFSFFRFSFLFFYRFSRFFFSDRFFFCFFFRRLRFLFLLLFLFRLFFLRFSLLPGLFRLLFRFGRFLFNRVFRYDVNLDDRGNIMSKTDGHIAASGLFYRLPQGYFSFFYI